MYLNQILLNYMRRYFRIGFLVFVLCLSTLKLHSEMDESPIHILVLKQNASQYNLVYEGVREYVQRLDKGFIFHSFDVFPNKLINNLSEINQDIEIIVSIGTKSFEMALTHFPNKSHIFGMVLNVDSTRISNISKKSGKRISGISILAKPEAYIEQLKLIQANADKIGLLYFSQNFDRYVTKFRSKAEASGISLIVEKIKTKKEFIGKFKSILKSDIDSFMVIPDFTLYDPKSLEHVIVNTYNRGIPCIGPSESFVKSGALWAFNVLPEEFGKQIGDLIVNRFRNEDEFIQYYSPSSVCINMIVAENLEIDIPYSVRKNAKLIDLRQQNEN